MGMRIGAEDIRAIDLALAVEPVYARTDCLARQWPRLGHNRPAHIHHRGDDLAIAGAAAQHTAQRILHGSFAGGCVMGQQRRCRYQHARRADAALRGAVAQEALLQLARNRRCHRQSLDRCHRAAGHLAQRHQTGAARLAIDEHGAGAAIAGIAADLGAGQAQFVAQHAAEAPFRRCRDRDRAAVEGEGDRGVCVEHDQRPTDGARFSKQSCTARRMRMIAASRR